MPLTASEAGYSDASESLARPPTPSLAPADPSFPGVANTPTASNDPNVFVPNVPVFRSRSRQIAKRYAPLDAARVTRASRVHDGHTAAEQIIYTMLWNAQPGQDVPFKDVAVGNSHIMKETSLTERTVQFNLRTLQLKLSIEVIAKHDPDTNRPKTYRVYSPEMILKRRHAAGLDWAQRKKGGGVRLVRREELNTPPF
jgi:hypothetical protein